jgi:hypothetical protein
MRTWLPALTIGRTRASTIGPRTAICRFETRTNPAGSPIARSIATVRFYALRYPHRFSVSARRRAAQTIRYRLEAFDASKISACIA